MEFLRRLDMEILIGQLSFKQRAEIFNSVHTPTIADMGRSDCISDERLNILLSHTY